MRTQSITSTALIEQAKLLAVADLRARDREEDGFGSGLDDWRRTDKSLVDQFDPELQSRMYTIGQFVRRCEELGDPPWRIAPSRLFLCTRPPSYFDIARRLLYRVESDGFASGTFEELLNIVNSVRGTSYLDPIGTVLDKATVEIPAGNPEPDDPADPRISLGNLVVPDQAFTSAATRVPGSPFGRPSLTPARLKGLVDVLNRATVTARASSATGRTPAAVLVLPELSVPRSWFRAVANHVVRVGAFGLIAGLEYLHDTRRRWVLNQVYAVLPGPYSSVATWPWTKRFPAREEAEALANRRVAFRPPRVPGLPRTVVRSPYGLFSVLICSEMLETRRAADLLGRVEVVFAPSWNTDTASYDHLIQSVGLQLNAIVAIANNGKYSDCRAWAPRNSRWQRDLCRLIERDSNVVVFVDIPLGSLRAFRMSASALPLRNPQNRNLNREWRPLPPDWP